MKVRELMTTPVIACTIGDTLGHAARLMWDHDCGAVPVLGSEGKVLGIVTDRDICMAAWTQGKNPHSISVESAMSRQVHSCRENEAVDAARRKMREVRVRRIPVVDENDRAVGMVSMNDLARQAAKLGTGERDLVQTLSAICEPRVGAAQSLPSVIPTASVAVAATRR